MEIVIKFVLGMLTPVIKFIGKIHMPFTYKKITGDHYYAWRDQIKKGHTFLTNINGVGSNLINISEFNHGSIYYGTGLRTALIDIIKTTNDKELELRLSVILVKYKVRDDVCYVLESVYDGVVPTSLVTFMTTKDVFMVVEPTKGLGSMHLAADGAAFYLGYGYDYIFSERNNKMYCFELVAKAYESALSMIVKRKVYSLFNVRLYSSFLSSSFTDDNWSTVIDSREDAI